MDWTTPADETLDAIGLLCPLPVLKARKTLRTMADDTVLEIHTTDPAAVIDMPHFCQEAGYMYLGLNTHDTYCAHRIHKTGASSST